MFMVEDLRGLCANIFSAVEVGQEFTLKYCPQILFYGDVRYADVGKCRRDRGRESWPEQRRIPSCILKNPEETHHKSTIHLKRTKLPGIYNYNKSSSPQYV